MANIRPDKKIRTYSYLAHKRIMGCFQNLCLKCRLTDMESIAKDDVKKVIIISLDYIGDYIVRTIPAIYSLKKFFPDASITVMAGSWTEELVSANPLVARVVTYNAGWLDRSGKRWSLAKRLIILREVHKEKFDLIVDARGSIGTTLLELFSPKKRLLYTDSLRHGDVVRLEKIRKTSILIDDESRESLKRIFTEEGVDINKRLILVHPSTYSPVRRWDNEKWAELCDRLVDRYDAEVIICGSKGDMAIANDIIWRMRHKGKNLSGKTSLLQLAALIDMSDLCISIDSGPMHIAGLLDVPVVGLFGPNNPKTSQPLTTKCRLIFKNFPCADCVESMMRCHAECMSAITCEDVISAADELIGTFWSPQKS